ncbi:MAG: glycoside hydrolase family 127 protein, partial [Oscillospiraceae bacterium]|nr:glycoside hydrolase family 127 protein [Oscillospiraceae bacterium]
MADRTINKGNATETASTAGAAMPAAPSAAISYRDVRITGGFWKRWQDAAAAGTIPAIYDQFTLTGRFDALAHKWRANEPHKPHIFYDSDAAKWIEGAAYSLYFRPDPETEKRIELLIDLIETGMSPEGYFNSYYQTVEPHERWTRRENHELYCAGHLIEAAVAYYESTGKRRFLDLMLRYAEYIRRIFVEDKSAAFRTPGHEEIELALVRLWQCTGDRKWLELAAHFVDLRGTDPAEHCFNNWFSPGYAQDQAPVMDQETAEGHVVRFGYLYAAVADLAAFRGDARLLAACRRVWRDVVERKMYVTGGVGNMKHGEAFGPAYFLPNYEAYTETCASIALAFFGRRLFAANPLAEYADICELQLYNGALAGISLDGRSFFYENPLSLRPSDEQFFNKNKASGRPVQRVEVFSCS